MVDTPDAPADAARADQVTAAETAIAKAIEDHDSDAYITALRSHPDYAALFEDGLTTAVADGLKADFERDYLPPGQDFDMQGMLQNVWTAFQQDGAMGAMAAVGNILKTLFSPNGLTMMFNQLMGGDPNQALSAELGTKVDAGRATLPDAADSTIYDRIVNRASPTPS